VNPQLEPPVKQLKVVKIIDNKVSNSSFGNMKDAAQKT